MIKSLQQKNSFITVLMLALGLSAAICGCGKDKPAPPAPPVRPAAAKPPAPPKPVQKPFSTVVKPPPAPVNMFDFSSKKDPFRPFAAVKPEPAAPDPKQLQKLLKEAIPIHSYDVSQFRLIGIIVGEKENRAMVVDPANKGYVLKIGMTIGKNEGRVTAITSSGVDVLEQFRDDNGKIRKERIKLNLPKK